MEQDLKSKDIDSIWVNNQITNENPTEDAR